MAERYERLEDALELLPLLWGPGAALRGPHRHGAGGGLLPAPVQERVRSSSGLGRAATLRLVARPRRRLQPLRRPDVVRTRSRCSTATARPRAAPGEITVTQLSEAAVIDPGGDRYADVVGTVEEQVGRYRELADAGVQQVFVALHEDGTTEQVERFAEVIAAFR